MLGIHDYWLFVAAGVVLNLTPGQDTLYILGSSIAYGRRIGLASALGISAGCMVHTLAAALCLSAIVARSATAFIAVKLAGAAYLIYLGIRALTARADPISALQHAAAMPIGLAFRRGLLTNVLNPKVAAFLGLGLTFVATGTVWCLFLAVLLHIFADSSSSIHARLLTFLVPAA